MFRETPRNGEHQKTLLSIRYGRRELTILLHPGCNTPGSGGVPNPAIPYNGPQPGTIRAGATKSITINNQWNGRIFNQNGKCGSKGEKCTVLEYNLGKASYTHFYFASRPVFIDLIICPRFRHR